MASFAQVFASLNLNSAHFPTWKYPAKYIIAASHWSLIRCLKNEALKGNLMFDILSKVGKMATQKVVGRATCSIQINQR
jgi:hypothetical protein